MNPLARLILEQRLKEKGFEEREWFLDAHGRNPKIWDSGSLMIGLMDDCEPFYWKKYTVGRYSYRTFSPKARKAFLKRLLDEEKE